MIKRLLAGAMAGLLTAASSLAAPSEDAEPVSLIQETVTELATAINAEADVIEQRPARGIQIVHEVVAPHVDIGRMCRLVLGRHWRDADQRQRQDFVAGFETLIYRTYATAVVKYADVPIEYLPLRAPSGSKDVLVRTRVLPGGRPPLRIDYRLRSDGTGWKVIDVTVEGVSLVSTYRSAFDSTISSNGIEGLIEQLQQRTVTAGG